MSYINGSCLLLSSDYVALKVIPIKQAFKLIFSDKAEVVRTFRDKVVHTVNKAFDVPAVIRLLSKLKLKLHVKLSRRNIFIRDGYSCKYCGKVGSASSLTIDHIIPRSRGGKFTWQNIITSCLTCNSTKGDRTPEEAGMKIIGGPPNKLDMYSYIRCLLNIRLKEIPEWESFI